MMTLIMMFVIMFLLIVTAYCITSNYKAERFQSSQMTNLKKTLFTNIENMGSTVGVESNPEAVTLEIMSMMVDILEDAKEIPNNLVEIALCLDAIDVARAKKGNKGIEIVANKEGYFVRLINPERREEMKCPYDIANRRIGVFDLCDYHLVQAIANGYRLPYTEFDYTIEYIPRSDWQNIEKILENDYDVMYAYIIPGSDFEKIIYSQRVYITGFEKMDMGRIGVFYPYIEMRETYMEDVYKWNSMDKPMAIYNQKAPLNLLWERHRFFIIGDPKELVPIATEPFVSSLSVSPEMSDPSYRCYGELTNENRALCNSSYDPWGNLKKDQTFWDIPCLENTDCPFYKANKNYPNELGKCMDNGICEFPIGVRRLAYVKYRDDFPYTPVCYGCDPDILNCCKDQKENPEKYPNLVSPDYAFQGDMRLREPRGMQTIIPML